jgi:CP family cyanate transporter-like MFS transporter
LRPSPLWYAAVILVAANLRPVITSVPPIVDGLTAEFGLSAVAAGALTTVPGAVHGAVRAGRVDRGAPAR